MPAPVTPDTSSPFGGRSKFAICLARVVPGLLTCLAVGIIDTASLDFGLLFWQIRH